jgi:hypothetical protein
MDTVMRAAAAAPQPDRASEQPSLLTRGAQWLRSTRPVPAWSIAAAPAAATLALVAVYLAAAGTGQGFRPQPGVAAALAKTESGKESALATLRPVLSFRSKSGGWCRQYEMRDLDRQVFHALACRGADGRWDVVASTPPSPTGIMPAGTGGRRAIDDRVTAMIHGDPLSPSDEAAAIGKGWR